MTSFDRGQDEGICGIAAAIKEAAQLQLSLVIESNGGYPPHSTHVHVPCMVMSLNFIIAK
ncbi:MAG: hypothetical protein RIG61_07220 [Deltaproteobacteria bacterium]